MKYIKKGLIFGTIIWVISAGILFILCAVEPSGRHYDEQLDKYTYLKLRTSELRLYYLNDEISHDDHQEYLEAIMFDINNGIHPKDIKVLDYICYEGSKYSECKICNNIE